MNTTPEEIACKILVDIDGEKPHLLKRDIIAAAIRAAEIRGMATHRILAEFVMIMNRHGPDSKEVDEFIESYRSLVSELTTAVMLKKAVMP